MALSQNTLDLSLLILCLGGRNLLYALSQCLPLLSLRTLHQHTLFVRIVPTVGCITQNIIQQNIGSLHGMSFLVNKTALEEAAIFLSQSNSIGGLCLIHSPLVDVALNNYHSAFNISHMLMAGRVHFGKEVSVMGVHLFSEDVFYPILVTPMCKSESSEDMEFIFKTTVAAWHASKAEKEIGSAWSYVTDGDTTHHKAGHHTFIQISLLFTSPLYGTLSNLSGLNLLTGEYEIMLDFDCKHALKLLYPDNPQDIPHAIKLINVIISLADIDPMDQCVDIIADVDAIKILVGILHSLLQPFIDIILSLTEQVISLSCFTHLLYTCYQDQQCLLMPNQLYYDL
ncbi:hypothetical protein BDR06DRAFT_980847 [Suillus hirtellus]|nr:hypothetical protein BDR06DRAFT_980847 [Suillus hirtellus]